MRTTPNVPGAKRTPIRKVQIEVLVHTQLDCRNASRVAPKIPTRPFCAGEGQIVYFFTPALDEKSNRIKIIIITTIALTV
jgi:hypothetical protein